MTHDVRDDQVTSGSEEADTDLHRVLLRPCLQPEADRLVAGGAGLRLQHQPHPSQHQRVVKVRPELKREECKKQYFLFDFKELYKGQNQIGGVRRESGSEREFDK